ncbi:hypothetical protein F5146DRAFT_999154 [Armillaria mellea]|nr:hypothetical protein F5146DRAFT_999154 [Armillaria mellea]
MADLKFSKIPATRTSYFIKVIHRTAFSGSVDLSVATRYLSIEIRSRDFRVKKILAGHYERSLTPSLEWSTTSGGRVFLSPLLAADDSIQTRVPVNCAVPNGGLFSVLNRQCQGGLDLTRVHLETRRMPCDDRDICRIVISAVNTGLVRPLAAHVPSVVRILEGGVARKRQTPTLEMIEILFKRGELKAKNFQHSSTLSGRRHSSRQRITTRRGTIEDGHLGGIAGSARKLVNGAFSGAHSAWISISDVNSLAIDGYPISFDNFAPRRRIVVRRARPGPSKGDWIIEEMMARNGWKGMPQSCVARSDFALRRCIVIRRVKPGPEGVDGRRHADDRRCPRRCSSNLMDHTASNKGLDTSKKARAIGTEGEDGWRHSGMATLCTKEEDFGAETTLKNAPYITRKIIILREGRRAERHFLGGNHSSFYVRTFHPHPHLHAPAQALGHPLADEYGYKTGDVEILNDLHCPRLRTLILNNPINILSFRKLLLCPITHLDLVIISKSMYSELISKPLLHLQDLRIMDKLPWSEEILSLVKAKKSLRNLEVKTPSVRRLREIFRKETFPEQLTMSFSAY